jgi:hypothetical protein
MVLLPVAAALDARALSAFETRLSTQRCGLR